MGRPKKENTEVSNVIENTETKDVGFALPSGVDFSRDNVKVEITDADKERFFKSFISDTPYEEERSLFDCQIKVTFRSITVDENNDIWRQSIKDQKSDEVTQNSEAYLLLINVYRLAMSLKKVEGFAYDGTEISKDTFKVTDDNPNTTYVKAKADQIKSWNAFKMATFLKAFSEFEHKLFLLEKDVCTQNFWKATV